MAITKEWLKKASISQSYSKGKDYYDEVDDLTKNGDVYTAIVYGSEEYEVTIRDFPTSDPSASCDCPYDHGGLCKHIIAVGLNIIDGNFEEEDNLSISTSDIFENNVLENPSDDGPKFSQIEATKFYDEFFLKQDVVTRMSFLRQLFSNDEKLRKQFYAFSKMGQPK